MTSDTLHRSTGVSRGGRRRWLALPASALALGALVAVPSPVQAARDVTQACPADVADDGFTDTGPEGSSVERAVDCLVHWGITRGTSASTYEPASAVRRDQMASFLVRMLRSTDSFEEPPAGGRTRFGDVSADSVHAESIAVLSQLDIALGTGGGRFSPLRPVDRAAMASFIVRTLEQLDSDLPVVTFDEFDDDEGSVHEDAINVLAELDIADGTSTGRFDPRAPVTRQQMALFLTRTLDHLVEDEGVVLRRGG